MMTTPALWLALLLVLHGNPVPQPPVVQPVGPPTYGGPGDTTGRPSGPSTGTPNGPAAPSPTTPSGGASTPTGAGPRSGSPNTGGGPQTGTGSGMDRYLDPTWDLWWHFHKEEFLRLKQRLYEGPRSADSLERGDLLGGQLSGGLRPSAKQLVEDARPALRAVLEHESNNELVTSTLLAEGRLGESAAVPNEARFAPQMLLRLRDPNQEVAETAALALGVLGSESELGVLEALVRDDETGRNAAGQREVSARTRSFAAYGLGILAQHVHSNRPRQLIARALTDVLARSEGVPADTQVACVIALGLTPLEPEREESASAPWISRQTELRFLLRIFESRETRPVLRAHAATSLAALAADASPEAKEAVADSIEGTLRRETTEGPVRESCLIALGRLGDDDQDPVDKRIRAELRRALLTGSTAERAFALMSLSETSTRQGTGSEPGSSVAEVREVLLEELARGKSRTRSWSMLALGVQEFRLRRAGGDVCAPLREVLRRAFAEASNPDELCAAALALGLAADGESTKSIGERLAKGGDESLRGYLALALGLAGSVEAAPLLRTVAAEARFRPFLLLQSAIALALLGDKSLAPELAGALRSAEGQASQSWIAQALGKVGDSRTIPILVSMLRDQQLGAPARGSVASALGIVCDKDELPWTHALTSMVNWRASSSTLLSGAGVGVLEIL